MGNHPSHKDLSLSLASEFTEVLPGDFVRDRPSVRDKRFPILGPRPSGPNTQPHENASASGPYIYFVYSALGEIKYIGKADERTVLYRWIRPDGRTGLHQWSHGTNSAKKKATIEFIADELRSGKSPVRLYFSNARSLRASVVKRAATLGITLANLETLPGHPWAAFRKLKSLRDEHFQHRKSTSSGIGRNEHLALLNEFKHAIPRLLLQLHIHFGVRCPAAIIRFAYFPEIERAPRTDAEERGSG